ncbi:11727_t:CDS:2 [Funneliformis caledonium]|uniref:11727_t:CDS:1 n=1 Tax=Funneliformis caledonium TaxID=1117310 RepID=A0A9N9FSH2_9GLOM|nr:11727_t:CDS:2 [Funneliformis caledonium]
MEFPIYDGSIHPSEWLKQVQATCLLKQITNDEFVLKIAKMMIDSSIKIPENISTFDALINALKADITFSILKAQMRRELQTLKYIPIREGGAPSKFINKFRKLCRDAEINNLQEQKTYLYFSLSNDYYIWNEFYKKMKNIKSTNELIQEFGKITIDETNLIRNGSIVALKHVATGKYLSSIKDLCYTTGSKTQLVFANNLLDSDALWNITFTSGKELASYTDTNICLQHKNSRASLGLFFNYHYNQYQSPVTQHTEVSCNPKDSYHYTQWKFNNKGYLKSNDIINLSINYNRQVFLRSHDLQFTIGNYTFQEVVCHNERLCGNDEWCIELIKQS